MNTPSWACKLIFAVGFAATLAEAQTVTVGAFRGPIPPDATVGALRGAVPADATVGARTGPLPPGATVGALRGSVPPGASTGAFLGALPADASVARLQEGIPLYGFGVLTGEPLGLLTGEPLGLVTGLGAGRPLPPNATFGSPTPEDIARNLDALAQRHLVTGVYAEAESLLRRSVSLREQALGPQDPRVADAMESSARLLRRWNRPAAAEDLEGRAKAIREKLEPRRAPGDVLFEGAD